VRLIKLMSSFGLASGGAAEPRGERKRTVWIQATRTQRARIHAVRFPSPTGRFAADAGRSPSNPRTSA